MHRYSYRTFFSYLAALINLGVWTATANANTFSLPPRLSANVYASDYTVGTADLMLPMAGDTRHNFYLDPAIAYGTDNQNYADLGLGYRWIKNDAAILGLYLFGGYTRIDNNARLWVANPGIEALGSRWDAHLNAYFPMGDRHTNIEYPVVRETNHSEFIEFFSKSQYASNGADISLGYQLFSGNSLKAYVGSYFFNLSHTSNLWGGAAGLEYWLTRNFKVFASYTYDNSSHSTGAVGLGIEFGGTHIHRSNPAIEERMTDPVQRYLAELGHGSAIPSRFGTPQLIPGDFFLISNNIAFFSETGGPNNGGIGLTLTNCTFENPCGPTDLTDLGASMLNTLLPNTLIYFNGGSYNALNVVNGTSGVTLQSGQSVSSRTADFTQPTTGTTRSTFNGAFILNSNNALNNIILLPTAATISTGLQSTNATNVSINGSQIGSQNNSFNNGVVFDGSQAAVIGSEINTSSIAMLALSSSNILIQDSTLNNTLTQPPPGSPFAGIVSSSSTVTVNHSVVNLLGSDINEVNAVGVTVDHGTLTMNDSNLNLIIDAPLSTIKARLIGAAADVSGALTMNRSSITVESNVANLLSINGLTAVNNNSSIMVNQSTINVIQESNNIIDTTPAYALDSSAGGEVSIENSSLNVTSDSDSFGILTPTSSNVTITNSSCGINGSSVTCS
ncbi:inverse autotransporter beta domain-containing protein [Rickettsiella endosymbiont of Aleochara curtula]|uniref:inverse autotransporter beta domain-containing protein n=1 Tax=Rickettsiella endosymbiont of Aleochara curtula TaxID=3077936 RepID=UPI00313E67B8